MQNTSWRGIHEKSIDSSLPCGLFSCCRMPQKGHAFKGADYYTVYHQDRRKEDDASGGVSLWRRCRRDAAKLA